MEKWHNLGHYKMYTSSEQIENTSWMFSTPLHSWEEWDGILELLHVAGISMATILPGVYQIFKWSFYNICKIPGIQTLSTCFHKFEIWAHVMICWCHLDSISIWNDILIIWIMTKVTQLRGHLIGNQFMLWNYRDLSGNALSGQLADIFNSIFGGQNRKTLSLHILDLSSNQLSGIVPKMPLSTSHLTQL